MPQEVQSACKDAGQRQPEHVGQSAFGLHLIMVLLMGIADLELGEVSELALWTEESLASSDSTEKLYPNWTHSGMTRRSRE